MMFDDALGFWENGKVTQEGCVGVVLKHESG